MTGLDMMKDGFCVTHTLGRTRKEKNKMEEFMFEMLQDSYVRVNFEKNMLVRLPFHSLKFRDKVYSCNFEESNLILVL